MKMNAFFGNGELRFIKTKIFGKPRIFQGRGIFRGIFPAFVILFDGNSKFWVQIMPFHPEIQALIKIKVLT